MTSNADRFAALFGTPAESEPPTGPRKPAPVPEVGQATAPLDRATILRAQFNDALHHMNINR